ncbi:MAG: SMI1/KNR4 family protein [Raineya sp.]|jgi:Leucine-rich repeat (LRR) protein|nr:SMI1/KNR4 family protein [Raineya sp.]
MNSQLISLDSKLKKLIEKDKKLSNFGSETHRYELNPTISEEYLQKWQKKYNIQLPQDYSDFLRNIANGGAGPYYGLYSLEEGMQEAENFSYINETENITEPFSLDFPISKTETDNFIKYYYQCLDDGEDDEIQYFESITPLTGAIFLAEYGCGWSYFLVVKGDLAGTVWFQGDYLSPCIHENRILSFIEWYEDWLDRSLADLEPQPEKKGISPDSTILNYDGWQLKEIPKEILVCKNLKKLVFSRNALEKFPMEILDFEQLRILDLSMTPIIEIPDEIKKLKNLKQLKLNYNYTLDLPEGLAELKNFEKLLMFYSYKLEKIPAVIPKIKSLKSLHLSHCQELQSLSESIEQLENLEHLYLNDCPKLNNLPDNFGKLKNLKSLFIGSTGIQKLPESFKELEKLEYLAIDAENVDMTDLVEKIKCLPNLHYLKISAQLEYPETLSFLISIKTLLVSQNYDLWRKGYKHLPLHENLTLMPNIEVLDVVNNNQANALPKSIGNWKKLKTLRVGATAIKEFPDSLQNIEGLSEIEGSLAQNGNDTFGIKLEEKAKVQKWFPKATISIW